MKKRGTGKTTKTNITESLDQTGFGKFTFHNGDIYNGEYRCNYTQSVLVKEGRGIYTTDNFDVYDGEWNNDSFADTTIHIRYNNNAQYRGRVEPNGTMNGPGTYTFPDGSSIEADWVNNKPLTNAIYREPRGFEWTLVNVTDNAISFSPGNHFWRDLLSDQSTTYSTDSFGEGELN
ncbi:phosphatidylinositol 4-phosphate 5-kinase 2-like [Osmia bicornis bicornis]|uniref:phosphatidylinositol 4-phosphate 5-kinase 2-like n=1 Tax=Osmia bicornis bicornis TaxID=1437191 RepID=UPI0010F72FA9|nr:phosphatidylinositol 4-phosphate 5-kinase 2-like [Osmia bicornis bicornis]